MDVSRFGLRMLGFGYRDEELLCHVLGVGLQVSGNIFPNLK